MIALYSNDNNFNLYRQCKELLKKELYIPICFENVKLSLPYQLITIAIGEVI